MIFFFKDTATTEIYTLSLHDALPVSTGRACSPRTGTGPPPTTAACSSTCPGAATASPSTSRTPSRSEEHTSELQSRQYLVCRLLLEKKQNNFSPVYFYLV